MDPFPSRLQTFCLLPRTPLYFFCSLHGDRESGRKIRDTDSQAIPLGVAHGHEATWPLAPQATAAVFILRTAGVFEDRRRVRWTPGHRRVLTRCNMYRARRWAAGGDWRVWIHREPHAVPPPHDRRKTQCRSLSGRRTTGWLVGGGKWGPTSGDSLARPRLCRYRRWL